MISSVIRACFPVAAKVVADRAEEINKLNVFPVPDGDTGTNMSLTLNTVVREIEALPASATIDDIAKAITHGSLMGARGNSGVITSQILRGIAEGLCDAKNQEHPTPADVAHAWRRGVKVAFKAVRKPVEGTILTVLRDVSAKADQLEKNRDLATRDMLDALVVEAYESVARTPELLPVLKENGVVDSGAFGFATFLEAFVNAATGKSGELTDFKTTVDAKADVSAKVQIELNDDWEGSEYRYCNEFLFKAEKPFDVDASLAYLATLGDCELIVGAYPDFKVHVHSNEPNRVLEYMLQFGQVYEVFIHNMDMESHDRTAKIADLALAGRGRGRLRRPDHEPLHGRHPLGRRGGQRRRRDRAPGQRQHPHGRRGRGLRLRGRAGGRGPHQDRAPGLLRDVRRGPRGDPRGQRRGHDRGHLLRPRRRGHHCRARLGRRRRHAHPRR